VISVLVLCSCCVFVSDPVDWNVEHAKELVSAINMSIPLVPGVARIDGVQAHKQ
jgi:hypothetical protein